MKKIFVLFLILIPALAIADSITLDNPETLSTPTSQKISEWKVVLIDATAKWLRVQYRWRDADGNLIHAGLDRNGWLYWDCRDIEVAGENSECIGVGDPHACCSGVGTGTCDDMIDSCFTDVFHFTVRSQDVGTPIGIGLRALIWNQMKQDILTAENDGTFE